MSDHPCQHKVLDGITVARCVPHSDVPTGIEMWAWSMDPLLPSGCPCEVGDRFAVASEDADPLWAPGADVILGRPRHTLRAAQGVAARELDRMPGSRLVAVPTDLGTLFQTHERRFFVTGQGLCAVCVYPWIILCHRGLR